jgi:tRNA nucleotidyltransferase (CCA-adding enzyme)
MADLLAQLDNKLLAIIKEVGLIASSLDENAYLVGGPVRDLFLKRPNVDLDLMIEGHAMRVAEVFAKAHLGSKIVHYPAFKTATVTLANGQLVDFATARKETYSKGGVFPKVSPSHIKDDLFRRDFTINAMAIAITPKDWGKVVDPFKGRFDLVAKRIRILHEKSFLDDPTRIVRAARFKARFGFSLERKTLSILKKAVQEGALDTIKPQRYMKEFNKILKEKKSKEAQGCLKQWNAYRPTGQ